MGNERSNQFEDFANRKPDLTILTDQALRVDECAEETFNLRAKVGPVYDIIRYPTTRTPMAILISGDWGTGKTSAMRWLESMLKIWNKTAGTDDVKVRPVWFYPWKYDNKEDVRRGLIAEVIIKSIDVENASTRTVISAAKKFGIFLGKSFIHALASIKLKGKVSGDTGAAKAEAEAEIDLASIKEILAEYKEAAHPEKAYLNEFESTLKDWVEDTIGKDGKERMVVFIDDLDRCMPDIALQVLEALKLYLNIPKLIFVVGVDRKVVEKIVIEHYRKLGLVKSDEQDKTQIKEQDEGLRKKQEAKAIQYLAKMFQVEVALEPTEKQICDFFDEQLKDLTYWKEPYLSPDEQELFRDLVLKYAGRNPREVKRLLNSALMIGAGAVMAKKDGIKFNQGLQLFFVRKILDEKYIMASLAGSIHGIEFFVQWSKTVRKGKEKEKDFPCSIDVPKDYYDQLVQARQDKSEGSLKYVSERMRKKYELEKPSFAPIEYHQFIQNPRFSSLLYLLQDEYLSKLMLISYPAEVAEVAAVVGTTKDDVIIHEAIARQLNKKLDELIHDDYRKIERLYLPSSGIIDLTPLESLPNLQRLDLSGTKVVDVGPLASLTNLQWLDLSDTEVSDVGPLSSLTNLQELILSSTQVTDIGPLSSLTNLNKLALSSTKISDIGPLSSLKNLKLLYLQVTKVSDVGPLYYLKNLQELWIYDADVTDEQIKELRKALPNCEILEIF